MSTTPANANDLELLQKRELSLPPLPAKPVSHAPKTKNVINTHELNGKDPAVIKPVALLPVAENLSANMLKFALESKNIASPQASETINGIERLVGSTKNIGSHHVLNNAGSLLSNAKVSGNVSSSLISKTASEVSANACAQLIEKCCGKLAIFNHGNMSHLAGHRYEIDEMLTHLNETSQTILAHRADIRVHLKDVLQLAAMPPAIRGLALTSSPSLKHPYARVDGEYATLEHWLLNLQKLAWNLDSKLSKYIANPISINVFNRGRTIIEFGRDVHAAYTNFMIHLGSAVAEAQTKIANATQAKLSKLAVATGQPDYQDLDLSDAKQIFMQGDKYFLGYGVAKSYDTAFKRYEAASKYDLPEAYTMMATFSEFGLGRTKDLVEAIKCYEKAAKNNFPEALNHLGRLYETGKGLERNFKSAFRYYKHAASLGHLDAMTNQARLLQNGFGCESDKLQAHNVFKIAADLGYAKAQNALGSIYASGVTATKDTPILKKNNTEAVFWFKKAADQGYAPAHYNLGVCYEAGMGVLKDYVLSKQFYKKAADFNHAAASCSLGYLYKLEKYFILAITQFHVAVSLGSIEAYYHLGMLYECGCEDENGMVIERNIWTALRYYEKAAQQNHSQSLVRIATIVTCGPEELFDVQYAIKCLLTASKDVEEFSDNGNSDAYNMLGELYETSDTPDYDLASSYYKKAVKLNHPRAMYNLAVIYEQGHGSLKINFEMAMRLYRQSARLKNRDAEMRLQELTEILE